MFCQSPRFDTPASIILNEQQAQQRRNTRLPVLHVDNLDARFAASCNLFQAPPLRNAAVDSCANLVPCRAVGNIPQRVLVEPRAELLATDFRHICTLLPAQQASASCLSLTCADDDKIAEREADHYVAIAKPPKRNDLSVSAFTQII